MGWSGFDGSMGAVLSRISRGETPSPASSDKRIRHEHPCTAVLAHESGPRSRRLNMTRESAASPAGTPGSSGSWWVRNGGVLPGYLAITGAARVMCCSAEGELHTELQDGASSPDAGHELPGGGQRRTPRSYTELGARPLSSTEPPSSWACLRFRNLPCLNSDPTASADRDLPADTATAYICSFECTFCAE